MMRHRLTCVRASSARPAHTTLEARSSGSFLCRTIVCAILPVMTVACTDALRSPNMESALRLASLGEPCGASFRVVTFEEDQEMFDKYQWPIQSDTVDICETWTGNDYRWAMQTVGTTEREGGVYDMARDGVYENGILYAAEQGTILQSQSAGSSMFDTFNSDASQIQASYDDPYYGIASGTGGGGTCIICNMSVGVTTETANAQQNPDTLFRRHGIVRRGVRALVDAMDEIGKSPEGYRRFRKTDASGERVVLLHPKSQLLMGEEFHDDTREISTRHEWAPASFGFVRSGSVIEIRARGSVKVQRRMTLLISNVRIAQ